MARDEGGNLHIIGKLTSADEEVRITKRRYEGNNRVIMCERGISNEILNDKSLPNQNYSQSVAKVMQEKIDFFKSNSGLNSIDYNTISGQLTILNGKQKILCQRKNPEFDLFKEFGVIEEEVQYIRVWLRQISVQNKEIYVQIKATVENDSQMYKLKLHTLWSPMKKDVCIGIIGYFDMAK